MLLDPQAEIMVQGITGREASSMVSDMLDYGSRIVAGVTPGKAGQNVQGVPVYDTIAQLREEHCPTVSIISVPAPAVLDAALEAFAGGIELCLIMTERIARLDTSKIIVAARQAGCRVIGPNSLGLIRPSVAKLGTIGGRIDNVRQSFTPGSTAVLSRSGGMTTELASFLTSHGIGQSIAIGVGGDPIVGSNFAELVLLLEDDPATQSVVIYGEPGGTAEEDLAQDLSSRKSRLRINAFLSGRFVDDLEGVRFGHAAVIVEEGRGSVQGKKKALREAGVFVAERFDDILEGLET
ncbi:MAG: succinate--CoA ligase subunit alpha [Planctomycetaceae bacterium]|nr:succinate--CoA ligase subunit alpha [Planctomycetaceae bacterium]